MIKVNGLYIAADQFVKTGSGYTNPISTSVKINGVYTDTNAPIILTQSMTLTSAHGKSSFIYSGSSDIYLKMPSDMGLINVNIKVTQLGSGRVGIISL